MSRLPLLTGLASTGSTQGGAVLLSSTVNVIAPVASGTGVLLPKALAGLEITIINQGANTLLVYPQVGGTVVPLSVNVGYAVVAGTSATLISSDGVSWSVSVPSYQSLTPSSHPTFAGLTLSGLGAGAVLSSSTGVLSSSLSPTLTGLTLTGVPSGSVVSTSGVLSSVVAQTATFRLNDGPQGIILGGGGTSRGAGNDSVALMYDYPNVSDDGRTIDIECKITSGTLSIRPISHPDSESASIIIYDITANIYYNANLAVDFTSTSTSFVTLLSSPNFTPGDGDHLVIWANINFMVS